MSVWPMAMVCIRPSTSNVWHIDPSTVRLCIWVENIDYKNTHTTRQMGSQDGPVSLLLGSIHKLGNSWQGSSVQSLCV